MKAELRDKIFYKFIVKHFRQQINDYFTSRIPQETVGVGGRVELNKWTHIIGGTKIDKNGVILGRTTEKHYNRGWNEDTIKRY